MYTGLPLEDAKTTTTHMSLVVPFHSSRYKRHERFPIVERCVHVIHPTLGRVRRVEPAEAIPKGIVASEAANHDPSNHSHEKGHRHCF